MRSKYPYHTEQVIKLKCIFYIIVRTAWDFEEENTH